MELKDYKNLCQESQEGDLWDHQNEHGLTKLSIMVGSEPWYHTEAERTFLTTFDPKTVSVLLDLVDRANRVFLPGLLNRDNMWGMEAREWRGDYEKLFGPVRATSQDAKKV